MYHYQYKIQQGTVVKKICFLFLFCISHFALSQSADPVSRHCLKWEKVCHQKEECVYRHGARNSCFRCLKPNHYGFHLYPHQIDRNTCNLKTVHYFQTMGYRCFQPKDSQTCIKKQVIQKCDLQCVKFRRM